MQPGRGLRTHVTASAIRNRGITNSVGRRRQLLLVGRALAGGFFALMMANPQTAAAATICTITSGPNTIECTASGATTNITNADAVANPSDDREQLFTVGGAVSQGGSGSTVNAGITVSGYGLAITNTNGAGTATAVINDGTITLTTGIPSAGGTAALNITGNGGSVTYSGTGAVNDGNLGTNAIVITNGGGINMGGANGAITATGSGIGILATSAGGGVTVAMTGTAGITGGTIGISASDSAGGSISVITGNQSVSGLTGQGILAQATGGNGNVSVTPNGTVSGSTAIQATAVGTGTVTVTASSGSVTGTTAQGIIASGVDGAVLITGTSGVVGATNGINAGATGLGTVTVSGSGNTTATAGQGIVASSSSGAVLVNRSGTVTAGTVGIDATSTGGGNVTVTGVGNVSANTAAGGGTGIIAAATGGNGNVSVAPNGTVSGSTAIQATAVGTGTVTVQSGFNVTGTAGNGMTTSTVNGLNGVNVTAGIIQATGNGIDASSTGTGGVTVNITAGQVGTSTATRVDGIGINASSSGASGNVNVISKPIFSAGDGIDATIASASTGNIVVTQNGAIDSSAGNGISASIVAGSAGTIGINANASITATSAGKDGIISFNHGTGSSIVTVASGITILGDPGIVNDTAGGNALVTVNNNDVVSGGVGIINRQNLAGGPGYATVTVGANSTITGDGTSADVLNGYGLYNLNKSTASTGAGTQNSPDTAFVVFGGTGNIVNANGSAPSVVVSGIFNQSYGSSAVVDTGGNAVTVNVSSGAVGGSFGINNSSASTTAGDVNNVLFTGASTINLTTGNTNSNTGILASNILSASNGNALPATVGSTPITVTTGTSSTINVTAAGTSSVPAVAGNNNIGISAVSGATASTVTVTIGASSAINVGAGTFGIGVNATTSGPGLVTVNATGTSSAITLGAGNSGIGINATNTGAGAGNIAVSTGTLSTITVGLGDATRGILASTSGTGTVALTIGTSSTITLTDTGALTSVGILASANGGTVSVTNNGTVSVTGGSGISGSATTGNVLIDNFGTVIADGSVANPVIVSSTTTGNTTINNEIGASIHSNNLTTNDQPADLAILVTSTGAPGTATITNAGTLIGRITLTGFADTVTNSGTWNVRDNGANLAASFGAGTDSLTNSGTINAGNLLAVATSTFDSVEIINNSGTINAGLFNSADNTIFQTASVQTVTNTGTMNVMGTLSFTGATTSSFSNAGGLIDMRTGAHNTTDLTALNITVGAGALSNTYAPSANAYNFVGGVNSRLGLDTFVGGVASTGANVPSDRLLISGTATSTTGILLNDTNTNKSGGYNLTGITLVGVNGASANAFNLTGLNCNGVNTTGYCSSTGDLLQTNRGPMGAIKKGFWFYPLLQSTHAVAVADGLTGAASTEYRLYGLPDVESYQLPIATVGAQNIFFDTVADWVDRQDDLRRWVRKDQIHAHNAARRGSDKSVRVAPGFVSTSEPGVWLKASGSWASRNTSQPLSDFAPAAGVLPPLELSFNQKTYSLMGGYDMGKERVLSKSDALVFGIMGSYVESHLDFKSSQTSFNYSGGTAGVSATYLNRHWFADTLFKADFLRLSMDFPTLTAFGFSATTTNVRNYGVLSNFGYRFEPTGRIYVEPVLSLAYLRTTIDGFSGLGATVSFNTGESLRGAAGVRAGGVVAETPTHAVDLSVSAKFWNEFTSQTGVVLASTGPSLTLDDQHAKTFNELAGTLDFANKGIGASAFVMTGVKFNSEFTAISAKGGVRYQW